MSDEGHPFRFAHSVHQPLRVMGEGGDVTVGVEDQQVVLLRYQSLVVDLLPDQEQDPVRPAAVISRHTLYQHIMVCHDDRIQPGLHSGSRDIFMRAAAVRVTCVHVQVDDDFVHKFPVVDDFPYSQV